MYSFLSHNYSDVLGSSLSFAKHLADMFLPSFVIVTENKSVHWLNN